MTHPEAQFTAIEDLAALPQEEDFDRMIAFRGMGQSSSPALWEYGLLLGQLTAMLGPGHVEPNQGFVYAARYEPGQVTFLISLDDEFRCWLNFESSVDAQTAARLSALLDEALANVRPDDRALDYSNAYGDFRFGVRDGEPFGHEVKDE